MQLASNTEIDAFLAEHQGWSRVGDTIQRTYQFDNFVGSMGFVGQVALLAEKANHHPDIDIRWNRVTLNLTTHDANGLTAGDLDLADRCDGLA